MLSAAHESTEVVPAPCSQFCAVRGCPRQASRLLPAHLNKYFLDEYMSSFNFLTLCEVCEAPDKTFLD